MAPKPPTVAFLLCFLWGSHRSLLGGRNGHEFILTCDSDSDAMSRGLHGDGTSILQPRCKSQPISQLISPEGKGKLIHRKAVNSIGLPSKCQACVFRRSHQETPPQRGVKSAMYRPDASPGSLAGRLALMRSRAHRPNQLFLALLPLLLALSCNCLEAAGMQKAMRNNHQGRCRKLGMPLLPSSFSYPFLSLHAHFPC